ncbi:MAG TPA: 6-phosphogluconolactonase [Candidatus Peribacteria bacterium]|nr:6-phosphogluconolactonase [Candidatus Peribacteria bacterium]
MRIETASAGEFPSKAATMLSVRIKRAIDQRGRCVIGLSGGSTPVPVYELLGTDTSVDWSKVGIFLYDERYVPTTDANSNQRLIRDTLLKSAAIPPDAWVFPDTSLPIDQCLADYAGRVKDLWDDHFPDIAILGMGDDGHIASLFPPLSEEALSDSLFALHTTTNTFAVKDRLSLTLNVVAAAQSHVFLFKGQKKFEVWNEMLVSSDDERRWPAKRVIDGSPDLTVIFGA